MLLNQYLVPHSYSQFYKLFRDKTFILLDIGCGSNSALKAKFWFPNVIYHGIDREKYYGGNSVDDHVQMDRFYLVDLEKESLNFLDNTFYDAIIANHVIEHLVNGEELIETLLDKVKVKGIIYIEFPNYNSLSLPSKSGTLNFCDDNTHKVIHDPIRIANILLKKGFKVKSGLRRNWLKMILTPFYAFYLFVTNKPTGPAYWDFYGFATYVYGIKN